LVGGQRVGEASPLAQLLLELLAPGGAGLLELLQVTALSASSGAMARHRYWSWW